MHNVAILFHKKKNISEYVEVITDFYCDIKYFG